MKFNKEIVRNASEKAKVAVRNILVTIYPIFNLFLSAVELRGWFLW